MSNIKFYKGESISVVFTAYSNEKPPKLIDVSEYDKEVILFTAFSTHIVKNVTEININSFRVDISSDESINLTSGNFNIVLKLSKAGEVKIGKCIPCILIDPLTPCCSHERLSIDADTIEVDMSIDNNIANFEMYFGNTITSPVIKTDELRRRIAFVAEKNEILIPIGENMTLYKAKARNVSKLSIKPNTSSITTWQEVPLGNEISIAISEEYDLLAKIEKSSTDSESSVYLFTKVIE